MIIYGIEIHSDLTFPLELPDRGVTHQKLVLTSRIPRGLKDAITCGFPLYMTHGRKVFLYSDRVFDGTEPGQPWCYEVEGLLRFYWRGGSQTIYYEFKKNINAYLLSFWFIHLLLPLYLTLEKKYDYLHAGAVEIDERPVLFIAPSMGGKSTLTEYFIGKGHTLVSDDKVATFIHDDHCMAVSSHPYHRPYRNFEDLGLHATNFTPATKPIDTFYALERASSAANVTISEIKGSKKAETLLPSYLYMFHFLMPERLYYITKILNDIRMFTVTIPWDLKNIDDVYQHICRNHYEIS